MLSMEYTRQLPQIFLFRPADHHLETEFGSILIRFLSLTIFLSIRLAEQQDNKQIEAIYTAILL